MPSLFDTTSFTARIVRLWPIARSLKAPRLSRPSQQKADARVEASFRTLFASTPADRRDSLIRYYRKKHDCTRIEAMKRAVEDITRDDTNWP